MIRWNELQVMQHYVHELEKTIYATQECTKETCKVCSYNTICKITTLLIQLIEYDITNTNVKGELKDGNDV